MEHVADELGVFLGAHVDHRLIVFVEAGHHCWVLQRASEDVVQAFDHGWVHALGAANAKRRVGDGVETEFIERGGVGPALGAFATVGSQEAHGACFNLRGPPGGVAV